jgi:photosystem II stability/assembly factor-like uncharacterized protein
LTASIVASQLSARRINQVFSSAAPSLLLLALLAASLISPLRAWSQTSPAQPMPVWKQQTSGVTASLRGIAVVSDQVAWASGSQGTVIRTADGGETWQRLQIPEPERSLDFRDLHAFDDQRCLILSAGSPGVILRTTDGGATWAEAYRNDSETIFFDALSFWDSDRGIAFSDPQDGRMFLIETTDGGESWTELSADRRPQLHPGESAFAASGTCLTVLEEELVWLGTGGKHGNQRESSARVFSSSDRGNTWTVADTPLPSTESRGIFSLAFANRNHGVAVGGDYADPENATGNVAITDDSGRSWRTIEGNPPRGYRSAVAVANLDFHAYFVAVGTTGTDLSADWGNSWTFADSESYHAAAFSPDSKAGWAVGADGRVARWVGDEVLRGLAK